MVSTRLLIHSRLCIAMQQEKNEIPFRIDLRSNFVTQNSTKGSVTPAGVASHPVKVHAQGVSQGQLQSKV